MCRSVTDQVRDQEKGTRRPISEGRGDAYNFGAIGRAGCACATHPIFPYRCRNVTFDIHFNPC